MNHLRILIVEDELIIAYCLAGIVRRAGHESLGPVMSGEEAIALAAAEHPDLTLMDFKLKTAMSGMDAARQIWERQRIPCLFISAFSAKLSLEIASCPGFLGMLPKPLNERN